MIAPRIAGRRGFVAAILALSSAWLPIGTVPATAAGGQYCERTYYSAQQITDAVQNSSLRDDLKATSCSLGGLGRFESGGNKGVYNGSCCTGAAQDLFAHAAGLLGGRDPRHLMQSETADALHENRLGQILCVLQPLAVAAALGGVGSGRFIVAGYSVEELAAWAVAGLFAPKATLDLAARRADAMNAASLPGEGLLFVRGLDRRIIDDLCAPHSVAVAIVNPGAAVVLGGVGAALDLVADEARRLDADRVVRLGVKVASHTPRYAAASAVFRKDLDAVPVGRALPTTTRLLSGIDAAPVLDVRSGLDKLAAQISRTVPWSDRLVASVEAGTTAFLELGPGRALTEMATSAFPEIPARSVEDFRSLEGVIEWRSRPRS